MELKNIIYKLHLDETGVPHQVLSRNYFPYFILCGTLTNQYQSENLKINADRIKFKYWGNVDIVFHSKEIGKRENDFSILKDPKIEIDFHLDLVNFLNKNDAKIIIVAVNKQTAINQGWSDHDIYEKAVDEVIKYFIRFLNKKRSRGQIIIESAGTKKEIVFLKKYSYYLTNGYSDLNLSHRDIKDLLTSISFVSKKNYDIETQMADILAYPAGFQCMCQNGNRTLINNSYEDKMCAVLQQKLIKINAVSSFISLP